ncbi:MULTISPECIES: tRNA (adenine(22)-N(1))-methyltransferase [Macrococcus]|uniref:tRNA (Adenine(22)-N(1))-methyltransferase TrmK n=1 Tax=Macrococcus psychrotolerans TaxID=3039389 RepID=A0AAU6R7L1_9STAP|nr:MULTISPECIES: tRNA (adenine(22)-N(1))-methyltransferase TrmK [Macrococcus]MDJ1111308.1 tRNA (adenine(22)-N(1))-methyltransferase TrmK [Macrococcus sp. S115]QYA32061.1 tRNA (adenine(22)-N(1))-methyltransferase TrmK [Macrococcus sp. 19Msa1099]QYA36867.1 tRNA (adenine(22)-N(1))-methyltransferase TrmK [Macrococcus caseolyticus]QYA75575.1 tRNA (adenine(22)-N(1))-methyltransferase TrmK [Macrococcus caseolyticus]
MINNRLLAVATYINHEKLADIGSDHAYLPIYAIEQGKVKSAVAGEVVKGPFMSAVENVKKYALDSKIDVRLGDGLDVIEQNEVDCITICGMGGPLISEILNNGKGKLTHYPTLILQSNIHTEAVRRRLIALGYMIKDEVIMKERKHVYEIIVAERNDIDVTYNERELKFGPVLLNKKDDVFKEKWLREYHHLQTVYEAIKLEERHSEKASQLLNDIETLKEVLDIENL